MRDRRRQRVIEAKKFDKFGHQIPTSSGSLNHCSFHMLFYNTSMTRNRRVLSMKGMGYQGIFKDAHVFGLTRKSRHGIALGGIRNQTTPTATEFRSTTLAYPAAPGAAKYIKR
jgi:hypothetical protein